MTNIEERTIFRELVFDTYIDDPNKSQIQIAKELNSTISRVSEAMTYSLKFRRIYTTQKQTNREYRANCCKSKTLCAQIEYLTGEIKRNKENRQFVSKNHNERELIRVQSEVEKLWERQLFLFDKKNFV